MRALPLTFAALALITPAAAQDGSEMTNSRTPENAHKFLAQLSSTTEVSAAVYGNNKSRLSTNIDDFRQDGSCASILTGLPRSYVFRDANGAMTTEGPFPAGQANLFAPHAQRLAALQMRTAPYRIAWGQVPAIVQSPTSQADGEPMGDSVLELSVDARKLTIFYPNAEIASRARLAMETLRTACEPAKNLGF